MSKIVPLRVYDIETDGGHLNPASTWLSDAYTFGLIIDFLTSRLPQSLPILRALQLGPKDGGAFFITTPLPPLSTREPTNWSPEDMRAESVWTMAYIDRANHPGTEMWTFSSLEMWPLIKGYEREPQKPDMDPWKVFLPFSDDVCQLAAQRNQIIRSTSTLDKLKGVAVRQVKESTAEGPSKLAAFAFAGEDGSIRTLHVDPAFRKMGLAKAVVRRVINLRFCAPPRQGPFSASKDIQEVYEGPHPLAFCGVLESNQGSVRTFKAIGGSWSWDVFWLSLDLDEAKKAYAL